MNQTPVDALNSAAETYFAALEGLPPEAMDGVIRSTVLVAIALEDILQNQDQDPVPVLLSCFDRQLGALEDAATIAKHTPRTATATTGVDVGELFVNAWTHYSDETYDHTVDVFERRLRNSGLDATFFRGKRCFDGGCGIGRMTIAMAKFGAAEIVAADIGAPMLDYLRRQARRHGFTRIETVQQDITNLARWPDGSFDFVASHGVLMHTPDCIGGLREHYRVLKPGGTLWLYLIPGGLRFSIYDRLRSVVSRFPISEVKDALQRMRLREGLVYIYLDAVLAPRTYHGESEILAELRRLDPQLEWRHAKGTWVVDDVALSRASRFGKVINGPEGEVRIVVRKSG